MYDGRVTHSTPETFNPTNYALKIENLVVYKIVMEDGPLMKCIRYFNRVKIHHDLMFEQGYCLHKAGDK